MEDTEGTPTGAGDDKLLIEVFSDYVCPWCYLASARIARLRREQPVEIRLLPFPLHPDTPEEGLSLEELFGGRDIGPLHERLYAMMDEEGLPHGERERTYNSRLAQELGKWASTQPGGEALHEALFRSYFVHDRNLAEPEVLLQAVDEAGLDRAEAEKVLEERSFREDVDRDWQRAREMGISGVPSFVAGGYMMTGCQPYEELERFVNYIRDQEARA